MIMEKALLEVDVEIIEDEMGSVGIGFRMAQWREELAE